MKKQYVRYTGGKGSVAETLASWMPVEAAESYLEPLFGGGSLYLGKEPARVNVLNDIDPDVMNMHEAVCSDPESVMQELARLPVSRGLYEEVRLLRDTAAWLELSKVERAARTIYLFSCAFNGNPRCPLAASPMTPVRFNRDLDLRPFSGRLQHATLECLDWSEFLDRYVMQQKKLRCLLMLDPPYVVTARVAHYRYRFGYIDHVLLARKLATINTKNTGERSVKIMLTYDDTDFIRALYRPEFGWRMRPLPIRYSAGRHAEKTNELLITNYEIGGGQ